jgi:hypothetical protein
MRDTLARVRVTVTVCVAALAIGPLLGAGGAGGSAHLAPNRSNAVTVVTAGSRVWPGAAPFSPLNCPPKVPLSIVNAEPLDWWC